MSDEFENISLGESPSQWNNTANPDTHEENGSPLVDSIPTDYECTHDELHADEVPHYNEGNIRTVSTNSDRTSGVVNASDPFGLPSGGSTTAQLPRSERKHDNLGKSVTFKHVNPDPIKVNFYKRVNGISRFGYHHVKISRNKVYTDSLNDIGRWNFFNEIAQFVMQFDLNTLRSTNRHNPETFTLEKKKKIYHYCIGYNQAAAKKSRFAVEISEAWKIACQNL